MYLFLLTADLMVPDPDHTAAVLEKSLGLPEPRPFTRQAFPNHAYIAHFLRVHPSVAVAPTRLEPQGHVEVPEPSDPIFKPYLRSLIDFQGEYRPIKAHATVLVTDRMPELLERLHRRRLPFRVAPWSEEMAYDRVWVGTSPEHPAYDPGVDGGLMIEVIEKHPLGFPEEAYGPEAVQPRAPAEGQMIRIVERGFIVRDLGDTLGRLSQNLDLEPAGPITLHEDEGFRRARFVFPVPNSSTLDLLEPTRFDSETGRYLNIWGPGPYYARIAVNGIDAKADDLASRGTRFARIPATSAVGDRLQVEPADVDGAMIEFVEWAG